MSLWKLFSRRRRDQDLDEEIRAHLAMATRDRIERGEDPRAAELAARREFGNRTLVEETTREVWGWNSLELLWQDVRYALRGMRRNPGFTTVAVLSLALGIGLNTAIFSLVDTLVLRTLPVREPGRLVEFLNHYPGDPPLNFFSRQSYEHFRDNNHVFSGITSDGHTRYHVRGAGLEPEMVSGANVAGNFFQLLGMTPEIGRLPGPGDSAVAVVSYSFWTNRFNRDPGIVGRKLVVEDVPVTIAGVAPRNFLGMRVGLRSDIWVTSERTASVIARLKPGVSIEQARAEMAVLFRFTLEERIKGSKDPVTRQMKFTVEPAGGGLNTGLRELFARPLLALMIVVGLLLLIACTNLANMLLARGATRQREMALRISLGAGRFRLMRQVLTESLLLSGAGALAGILLAYFGARALVRLMTSGRPIVGMPNIEIPVQVDQHVLFFTCGIALLTALLFGLAPAWYASATAPAASLLEARRGGETGFRRLFGKSLVVAQVALSVAVLSAAGVFIHHLSNLKQIDLGFRRDHVLLVTLNAERSGLSPEQLSLGYQELLERVRSIPGVRAATLSGATPISGGAAPRFVTVKGHTERREDRRYVFANWVAPKYFETLGTPLPMGRDFTLADRGRPRVAIVNEAMARYYFGDSNPLGKHFTFDDSQVPYEIVEVAGNAKYSEIREPAKRIVYLNTFQFPRPASALAIHTGIDPEAVGPAVRRVVGEMLKTVAVSRVTTLAEQIDASIVPERLVATLSGLFGVLGSLLAAIGIHGLLAYTVARRINEIGIRMALGATQGAVSRMVLREALGITCAGLAIGAPIAYWGRRVAAGFMPGLPANGAFAIAAGAVAIVAVALMAAYLPARRAARVDPVEALRSE